MPSKILACATLGLRAEIVEVESDIARGLFRFAIVGLPDTAVSEARDRVFSAIKNSGYPFPRQRITVNLAPADIRKEGPLYDLPIALSLLQTSKQVAFDPQNKLFVGELSLHGEVRSVTGLLSIVLKAKEAGIRQVFVPAANAQEASLISGIQIFPITYLKEVIDHLEGRCLLPAVKPGPKQRKQSHYSVDFAYIRGQEHAKRALEIAAAGGHNILMVGPPGSGKTLLARALPSILPGLHFSESLEVTRIYSVAGALPQDEPLIFERPFRSPHHTASNVSLVGGGTWPRPGEISLAHRGVLFLDEFLEFPRSVLETLRQPLEDGVITIARAQASITYPAQFFLVAAMNPCPCGNFTDPERECVCAPGEILRYQKKISSPLLDRIDMYIEVPRVEYDKLAAQALAEASCHVRARVEKARARQQKRFLPKDKKVRRKIMTNSEMDLKDLRKHCSLLEEGRRLMRKAVAKFHLTARGYYRILRLARTIADLEGAEEISTAHIAESLQYRTKDSLYF